MPESTLIVKIVSGGQTGADRAALDAAIAAGCPYGGWLPKGRKAEDGPLDKKYNLQEMASSDYRKRTEQNVIDSDGTLIVSHGRLSGGSLLTLQLAEKHGRPCLHLDVDTMSLREAELLAANWLQSHGIRNLNVAGPRASGDPAIYEVVHSLVAALLTLKV